MDITVNPSVPPQAIEAEQSVLGALLNGGDEIGEILEIFGNTKHIFYDHAHQKIFNICFDLYRESKPVDMITVIDRLTVTSEIEEVGGRDYIVDLAESASLTVNSTYYAQIVKEKSVLRSLSKAGADIAQKAHSAIDMQTALDFAQQAIFEIGSGREQRGLVPVADLTTSVWHDIEYRSENRGSLLGMASGFNDLDLLTSGFQKSDLIIVAARPSMGKTAFCLNIAAHVALKVKSPIALFSLEMSKQQLVHRLICSNCGIDSQRLRTGNLRDEDWSQISHALAVLAEAPIYIDDSPILTTMELRAKARRLKTERKNLGLIVIDYIQLMQGSRPENRVQEISEISRGLKTLARELEVPIIALSQLSRSVEARQNKRPMLSDLRESGAIEQDADLVMFLYRHEYYEPEASDNRGECEVHIAKQRNGPVGTIKLHFHAATTTFHNLEKF
ncbi:MAG: replicative DNA helicase [Candidatus Caenarcaniphilales bacterium]|nr:replicative DNA helicase [Candidatus Caenarcaniphilales bacterium]